MGTRRRNGGNDADEKVAYLLFVTLSVTYWWRLGSGAGGGFGADFGAGKWADMIAVDGDPLKDVKLLQHVAFVMQVGGGV